MSNNKVLIFEFVSGGGFSQASIPTSIFCEGFGMLRSIIEDFKALDFEIHTMLDYRIFFLSNFLQADFIRKVEKNDNYIKIFKDLIINSKYVFIIAPETSEILYELTKTVKNYDKILLSTNLKGIKFGTSKIVTYKTFKKNNISTPKSYPIPFKKENLDIGYILNKFRKLNCPVIIKPEDGVGAEFIQYFETESQILEFFMDSNVGIDKKRNYIIQEFIEGRDLSLSLIGSPNLFRNPIILSVNSQNINIKNKESEYFGGYTPLESCKELIEKISNIIIKLKNLKIEGYFGIDFIKKHNHSFSFIEINPRLTTSYIGLRNILNFNCAALIFKSKVENINNYEIELKNYSYFTRIDFNINLGLNNQDPIQKLMKLIPEFVTPPISLNKPNEYSCFIATKTKDLSSSKKRINEIIEILENFNFNIIKPKKIV